MKNIRIELWIMPSGEEKIKMIQIDNQPMKDSYLPNMQTAFTPQEIEELANVMSARIGAPCELYRQGILIQAGILTSFDKATLGFEIE